MEKRDIQENRESLQIQEIQEMQDILEAGELGELSGYGKAGKSWNLRWRWKPKKKTVILLSLLLVAAVATGFFVVQSMRPQIAAVATIPLERQDLRNTVNVTGTVFSDNVTEVYAPLTGYNVKLVPVAVGDRVNVGDTLCELDVESLRKKIEESKAALSTAQAKAYHSLRGAELSLETEQYNLDKNYDADIMKAESAVKTAEMSVEQALELLGIANATYREKRQDYKDDLITEDVLIAADEAATRARHTLEDAEQTLKDARATLKATQVAKQEAEVQSKLAITNAQLGADFSADLLSISNQENDLEKAVVKAPVSGTVTAVFAKEGATGAGLMFVIEDTDDLIVNTKVKEYDIANVHTGLYVEIKADGAGDVAYDGEVRKIAPTSIKGASGETVSVTEAEFETEIDVVSINTDLRIGMNARLAIMTEEKKDVLAVSYDSVTTNANGDQVVFVARKTESIDPKYKGPELYTAYEIAVETGMETDYLVEISSGNLAEGDLIIGNPVDITDGMTITLGQAGPDGAVVAAGGNTQRGGPGGGAQVRVGG